MNFVDTRIEFVHNGFHYQAVRRWIAEPWTLTRWPVDAARIPPCAQQLRTSGWEPMLKPTEDDLMEFPHTDGIREYVDPLTSEPS